MAILALENEYAKLKNATGFRGPPNPDVTGATIYRDMVKDFLNPLVVPDNIKQIMPPASQIDDQSSLYVRYAASLIQEDLDLSEVTDPESAESAIKRYLIEVINAQNSALSMAKGNSPPPDLGTFLEIRRSLLIDRFAPNAGKANSGRSLGVVLELDMKKYREDFESKHDDMLDADNNYGEVQFLILDEVVMKRQLDLMSAP